MNGGFYMKDINCYFKIIINLWLRGSEGDNSISYKDWLAGNKTLNHHYYKKGYGTKLHDTILYQF